MSCKQILNDKFKDEMRDEPKDSHHPINIVPFRSKDYIQKNNDGIDLINPVNSKWHAEHVRFNYVVRGRQSAEPILELSGLLSLRKRVAEIHAQGGTPLGGGPFSGFFRHWSYHDATSTGISIKISSLKPGTIATIYQRFDSSYPNMVRRFRFVVPEEPTSIYIPWGKFEIANKTNNTFYGDRDSSKEIFPDELGLLIEKTNFKEDPTFGVRIHGPIVFERDIANSEDLISLITSQKMDFDLGMPGAKIGRSNVVIPARAPKQTPAKTERILTLMVQNLHSPTNQNIALEFGRAGEQAVLKELRRIGFNGFTTFHKKLSLIDFFATSPLNVLTPIPGVRDSSPFLKTGEVNPNIPFESGNFCVDHGPWTHGLQIIAMTRGMNEKELEYFRLIFANFFTFNSTRWALWDILFDAPGNQFPNSPRYWRDRLP